MVATREGLILGRNDLYDARPTDAENDVTPGDLLAATDPNYQSVRDLVVDDSPESVVADAVAKMMVAYHVRGEVFAPFRSLEDIQPILDEVRQLSPDASDDAIREILETASPLPTADQMEGESPESDGRRSSAIGTMGSLSARYADVA